MSLPAWADAPVVEELPGRHRVLALGGEPASVLKLPRHDPEPVRKETRTLRGAARLLPEHVPTLLATAPDDAGHRTLRLPPDASPERLGHALARVHRALDDPLVTSALPRKLPGSWTLGAFLARRDDDLSLAYLQMLQPLWDALPAMVRTWWDNAGFCHGDVRPENVLQGPHGAVLVDWEWSAVGDPLGDVAAWVAGHLAPGADLEPDDDVRAMLRAYRSAGGTLRDDLGRYVAYNVALHSYHGVRGTTLLDRFDQVLALWDAPGDWLRRAS